MSTSWHSFCIKQCRILFFALHPTTVTRMLFAAREREERWRESTTLSRQIARDRDRVRCCHHLSNTQRILIPERPRFTRLRQKKQQMSIKSIKESPRSVALAILKHLFSNTEATQSSYLLFRNSEATLKQLFSNTRATLKQLFSNSKATLKQLCEATLKQLCSNSVKQLWSNSAATI